MIRVVSPSSADVLDWEWITQNRSHSWPRLVCQQLADRAARSPRDEVMGCGDRVMDAEEFALRTGGLARRLLEEQSSRPVVVFVDRSLASAVALMAVHWVGRCLVPLDVDDLPSRSLSIIERIGECTVADATGRTRLDAGTRTVIDASDGPLERIDPVAVPGDSDALVAFTSGSTGIPKGVIRTGWQVDAAIAGASEQIHERRRSAVMSPLHWLGGFTTHRVLIGDGYQYIVDPTSMSASELVAALRAHRIDVVYLAPSLLKVLSAAVTGESRVETLTGVRVYGEPVDWSCVQAARSLGGPATSLTVTYGATELAGSALCVTVDADVPLGHGLVPFSVPSPDHVTFEPLGDSDSDLREIVVHRWVGKGYWGDPENTRRVFEVDEQGQPMYRTGDLARVDSDGRVWLAGRIDDVVKVSGKLVNPSESAAVIAGFEGVRKAVVLPRTLESGKKQLVAHVEADVDVDPGALRRTMAQRLPAELIPWVLVRHDVLPLLAGGKVDRQRLLSVPVVPWRVDVPRQPRTKLEAHVLREVSLLLGVVGLGVDDDLWSFGLDSLGAIELTEVLTKHFSTSLGVNDFVGASTVAALARLLASNRVDRASHVVDFGPQDAGRAVFVFPGGGAPILSIRHLAAELMGECRVFGVEQYGLQQRHRPDRSVRASARRNIAEMLTVQAHGPFVLVGHSWGGLVAHEMACQLRRAGHEVWLVLLDTANPAGGVSNQYMDGVAAAIEAPAGWRHGGRGRRRDWRWLLHRLGNHVRRYTMPAHRYWRFFRVAVRSARRHRPQVFGGPMLVVDADHSTASATWSAEPGVRSVRLSGNHRSILDPPHVNAVAETITSFLRECQEGSAASRAV